jgi:polar amino acid transport system substrate-binding protein
MEEDNLKLYDLYIDAVADLDIGTERLDAVVLDLPVAQAFAEDDEREVAYTILTGEFYGFGVREGETELLAGINAELEVFIASAAWIDLINEYFGQ